jgi:hypothetical protein
MPSDTVAAFLEQARELRLLADADLDRLADSPDADADLPAFTRRLVSGGLLTPFQADRILTGRGYTLGFAGFPLLDELDEHTYQAVEPSTRSEVRLSLFSADFTPPTRTPHPALAVPMVAGTHGGEGYAVHRKPDGAHQAALVGDMGPMPALLAAEYTRQAAVALAAAHAAGGVHAHIRPQRLFVGPLVQASKPKSDGSPRYRPGPTATVGITDYGLPPRDRTAADDVFALGGVLFHLLTGRDPGGASLSASRPDCPPELVSLVKAMLALAPADRPTMAEVVSRLTAIITPGQPDAVSLGKDSSPGVPPANVTLAENEQVELVDDTPQLALAGGWAGHPAVAAPPPAFTPQAWAPPPAGAEAEHEEDDEPAMPRRSRASAASRGGSRPMLWMLAGAFVLINVLALLVWGLMLVFPLTKK